MEGNVKKISKKDCNYIVGLRNKLEELESYRLISKRVELLEGNLTSHMQYNRRESIEISGLDKINNNDQEKTIVGILEDIGVGKIESWQVQACHRLKNPKNVIIKFVSRKHAALAIHNRKKLMNLDNEKHGLNRDAKIFINENLCRPLKFLHYKVRQAYKNKKISYFNLWKGKLSVKLGANSEILISSILMISLILILQLMMIGFLSTYRYQIYTKLILFAFFFDFVFARYCGDK